MRCRNRMTHAAGRVGFMLVGCLLSALGAHAEEGLSVRPSHTMAPPGGRIEFTVRLAEGAAPAEVQVRMTAPGAEPRLSDLRLGPGEEAVHVVDFAEDAVPGVYRFSIHSGAGSPETTLYVDVVPPALYDAFSAAAERVRVSPGEHWIFVGDSLTAQRRGFNYVDKIEGWLRHFNGDSVRVTNAGVGGDFITRVLARLDADVLALRPTRVFVFLGHNDSKLSSRSDYTRHTVAPEAYENGYRELVRRVREETGARVTVLSATASIYEITSEISRQRAEAGRAHNLFGRPDALEQFNALARAVAEETGAGYLDLYEPTRTAENRRALFTADGVHLSDEGNRWIALWILEQLAALPGEETP